MRLRFLGTGTSQGIPVIGSDHEVCRSTDPKDKRLRSSVLFQWKDFNLVIDCGPDFRQQMLLTDVRRLDAILFTHYHADHTAGLDDIRPYSLRQGALDFYADTATVKNLKERFAYIFAQENRYPGAPEVRLHQLSLESFQLGGKEIIPVEVMHGRLPIKGFRIEDTAYLTDVKTISGAEMNKLKDLDVLVISALRTDPHPTHLNLDEALAMVKKINPKRAYFTHISHRLGFHREVSAALPENVYLAYDGLELDLSAE